MAEEGDVGLLAFIRELEQEEHELEQQLMGIRKAKELAELRVDSSMVRANLPNGEGIYNGWGVEEAAEHYLAQSRTSKRTPEVRDALLAGGIQTESTNFNATVFGSLKRLEHKGKVKKVGAGRWEAVR